MQIPLIFDLLAFRAVTLFEKKKQTFFEFFFMKKMCFHEKIEM